MAREGNKFQRKKGTIYGKLKRISREYGPIPPAPGGPRYQWSEGGGMDNGKEMTYRTRGPAPGGHLNID